MWRYTRKGCLNRILDIYSLGLAKKITVQFDAYTKHYPKALRNRIVTIPNPVYGVTLPRERRGGGGHVILYVARLCFQKNHQLLLHAFSLIADDFKDWKIILVGDGEYRRQVSELISTLNLNGKVELVGPVVEVERFYAESDIFAFPSLFEGFPNALAEALASGLPCIGLHDTLGVNQLIQDGVNGLLVEDNSKAFAGALVKLMGDSVLRYRMGAKASLITERYPPQTSFDLWESVILEVSCT